MTDGSSSTETIQSIEKTLELIQNMDYDSSDDEIMTNCVSKELELAVNDPGQLVKEIDELLEEFSPQTSEADVEDMGEDAGHSIDETNTTNNGSDDGLSEAVESEAGGSAQSVADFTGQRENESDLISHQSDTKEEQKLDTTETEEPKNLSSFNGSKLNEDFSSASLSDDTLSNSSNCESCTIKFPSGESVDLREHNCHSDVIRMTTNSFKTVQRLKERLSKSDSEVTERNQMISELSAHSKEVTERNKKLHVKVETVTKELEKTREQLTSNHNAARAAIGRLQKESSEQIKKLHAQCTAMQKEKETAVMNFARREKELLDAKRVSEAAEKRARDAIRERDKALAQMRGMKMDIGKMKSAMEKMEAEAAQAKRETEKVREDAGSQVIKVKWAQNKLKSETDAHSETKEKLAKSLIEIKRAKEEAEQIRINCQGMIKTYQESEEMRSNSLDSQLKEKEMLLSQQEAKSGELEGIQKHQMDELRRLKQKHKDALEENMVMKTRVDCLEKERLKNEETLKGYSELLNRQKKEAVSMSEKMTDLEVVKGELESTNDELERLRLALSGEKEAKEQMRTNEENWKTKEHELLQFTQRVSSKNAELTSECENLSSKLENVTQSLSEKEKFSSRIKEELETLKADMSRQMLAASDTSSELTRRLEDKETTVNQLTLQLDELKDEIRTLKRKNNANIKDLTRQLQQARRKLEPYESATYSSNSGAIMEDGSMGSRASSDTSLDCVGRTGSNNTGLLSHNSMAESNSISGNSTNGNAEVPETIVTTTGEINKQALIERIVRLQRIHARKNEKIDFLQDHVQQLIDEMQKKNRVIQHYILREESGMLMHENAIRHISANDHSGKISRHLSMEVNRKMQSVLEDTLLKNIALKESVDALGKEIARISIQS